MRRLVATAVVAATAVAVADGRSTGRLAILAVAALVVIVVGRGVRRRLSDSDTDPALSMIAELPPQRPSVATHDITELATTIGRGRRGELPIEIADRIRTIARQRLDDTDAARSSPAVLSPTLTGVLDGGDVRAEHLDALLTELERL